MSKYHKLAESLNVPRNTSKRFDCPNCGYRNSLSVTNTSGHLKFHCFNNGCEMSGQTTKDISLADIRATPMENVLKPKRLAEFTGWDQAVDQPGVRRYLAANNCSYAYGHKPSKFFYDKINERLVFIEYDTTNKVILATGRSLRNENPKWYKYMALPATYYNAPLLQSAEVSFIVEDCASACSLARISHTMALCGTSYNAEALIRNIKVFGSNKVIICLDADAQIKALKIKQDLKGLGSFSSVQVLNLPDDAKNLSYEVLLKEIQR